MARTKTAASADELRALVRGAGLRVTAPRLAVLRELQRAGTPVSHAELSESLAADGWDRATLYRNLVDLSDAGLVRRSDLGDHVWRFELRSTTETHTREEHPHFVCNDCGVVTCLPDDAIQVNAARGVPRSVRSRAFEVQLKGTCDKCT